MLFFGRYFSCQFCYSIKNACVYYFIILLFYHSSITTTTAATIVTGPAHMRAFVLLLYLLIFIYMQLMLLVLALDRLTLVIHFIYILLLLFTSVLDIKMHSPPITPPRPHGSSRMTGGIFRGSALGNTLNAADFDDVADVLHPIHGKVLVYSSNQDPANLSIHDMKPSAFIKHNVTPSIELVLKKVADKYSPIRSELSYRYYLLT